MSAVPPMDLEPVILAAYVARAMSKTHRLAFAQIDSDLSIVLHSPNFPAIIEGDVSEIKGTVVTSIFNELIGAEPYLTDILKGHSPMFHLEYVNRVQPDGSITYLDFKVMPLADSALKQGLLLLIEDVTEGGILQQNITQDRNELRLLQSELTQANEELQRISQLKSLLLSMAAHDLRAPLSVITGYSGLMKYRYEQGTLDKLSTYLDVIESQTMRINDLITDMVDIDAIDRGVLQIDRERCDFVEIIEEVIQTVAVVYENQNISLTKEFPQSPVTISVDKGKISRVIYNLVSNAFKYTPSEGKLAVKLSQEEDELVFKVSDNGYGLNKSQLARLFQPYYRTQEARDSAVAGSGLGLYIVKMLVEAHHGRVMAASEVGNGTQFTIYLPMTQQTPEA